MALTDKHAAKRIDAGGKAENCVSCRYFFPTPFGNHGDCRFNPPNGRYEGFPTVNPADWCSKYLVDQHKIDEILEKEKEDNPEPVK